MRITEITYKLTITAQPKQFESFVVGAELKAELDSSDDWGMVDYKLREQARQAVASQVEAVLTQAVISRVHQCKDVAAVKRSVEVSRLYEWLQALAPGKAGDVLQAAVTYWDSVQTMKNGEIRYEALDGDALRDALREWPGIAVSVGFGPVSLDKTMPYASPYSNDADEQAVLDRYTQPVGAAAQSDDDGNDEDWDEGDNDDESDVLDYEDELDDEGNYAMTIKLPDDANDDDWSDIDTLDPDSKSLIAEMLSDDDSDDDMPETTAVPV